MISQRKTSDTPTPQNDENVVVYLGDKEAIEQPETFRFCPLGVQFYSHSAVAEYALLECRFNVPNVNGDLAEIECTGLVVQCCEPMNGDTLYRIWVKFLNLSEETLQHIQNLARRQRLICPFCRNF